MPFSTLNFPVWDLGGVNGGLLIAIIAIVHVFIAHFAVGGGFFLVAAEYKGVRENSPAIQKWVHKHTKFFLLVTMVFGSMTGVGIWLIISLVSPAGISLLIREFVYAWAAEWVFFLAEIITLLLYAASFSRMRQGYMHPGDHMLLGAGYALFAFLSLVVINGIVSFMLTPGAWIEDRNFWSALFNPTYWPALLFRTSLALILAGLFGLFTAVSCKDPEIRNRLVRFCAKWITAPFVGLALGAYLYIHALPEPARQAMHRGTQDISPYIKSFVIVGPVLFLAGLLFFIKMPKKLGRPAALFVLLLGLMIIGSFEWVRETARRPWLVSGYMYSNGITVDDGKRIDREGFFANSGWSRLVASKPSTDGGKRDPMSGLEVKRNFSELTAEERGKFSRFMFKAQCSGCHGVNAGKLDIVPRVAGRGQAGVAALLGGQGIINNYMPPVFGTAEERQALAEWLAGLRAE